MIHASPSHAQYLQDFQARRKALDVKVPHDETPLWVKFRQLDLSAARPILERLYVPGRGRPARDPIAMFRSYLLMLECHITSIPLWVQRLHDLPFYALLSGFAADEVPGVGTFYDFQDRLLCQQSSTDLAQVPRCRSEQRKQDGRLENKNDTAPHAGILERLARRLQAHPAAPAPYGDWTTAVRVFPRYQQPLQEVFFTLFVTASVRRGLIDLEHLCVAGDGTHLSTWAAARGHKLCACDNRAKPWAEHCTCPRRFHDALASWGWDSYRKCYVYGHGLYELTAYSLKHTCQLPLVLTLADNQRHDSVVFLALLECAVQALGFPLAVVTADAAHDALALYRLAAERWHVIPIVPLNPHTTAQVNFPPPTQFTPTGVPLCPAGRPMAHDGFERRRQRDKWRCPFAARDQRNQRNKHRPARPSATTSADAAPQAPPAPKPPIPCPHVAQECSPSPYGRTLHTYPKDNYRLYPRIPRDSPQWQLHADARSCSERSIKRKKLDFGLETTRIAGRERWFLRAILAAMCQHLEAWVTNATPQPEPAPEPMPDALALDRAATASDACTVLAVPEVAGALVTG
jgi:hypothetical protein